MVAWAQDGLEARPPTSGLESPSVRTSMEAAPRSSHPSPRPAIAPAPDLDLRHQGVADAAGTGHDPRLHEAGRVAVPPLTAVPRGQRKPPPAWPREPPSAAAQPLACATPVAARARISRRAGTKPPKRHSVKELGRRDPIGGGRK
ncbi:hypothetical protein PR202_ga09958 [Eleusine coracana subsp. coracana]|uniref:Uncharacterized protein n=1 Tax=Eleusine coracana subsp. coracana TaxID=191504 RepID=A0AAV5C4E4_ELECO|nr:hypothetical protein PR202_ga09958 [Eleusine coracana subsp. coracana]